MLRAPEDVRRRAGLRDLAVVDHHHLVGHVGHHAEVVSDHQDRHAELLLELAHEVQNLRLDRDVEGGRGLVGDQQGRAADQRHRQHGALPQAARQFERIHLVGALRVLEADETEHVLDFVVLLALGHFAVQHQRLADLVADAVDRRERGHRLLEDHADATTAQRPDLRPVPSQTRDVDRRLVAAGVREQDPSAQDQAVTGQQAHHALGNDRLAGPGLADQRHRLPGRHPKADTLHDFRGAALHGEADAKVLDTQNVG